MLTAYPGPTPSILVCMTAGGLVDALPRDNDPDALYEAFVGWSEEQGLTLYPHQEEAAIELFSGNNVILATPTGSREVDGRDRRALRGAWPTSAVTFYTAPIKALVSEKFFALCAIFGAENVGMLTGDASVNSRAPIICCTAEVLANIALREGADADVGQVVMDEFHFYAEPQRGWAWQVPLLTPAAGAVPADVGDARRRLRAARGPDAAHRPRDGAGRRRRAARAAGLLVVARAAARAARGARARPISAPVYVVHFTQASALERAQALVSAKLVHARGARRDRRRDRRLPLHRRLRQDAVASSSAAASASTTPACCRATGGWSSSSRRPGC